METEGVHSSTQMGASERSGGKSLHDTMEQRAAQVWLLDKHAIVPLHGPLSAFNLEPAQLL